MELTPISVNFGPFWEFAALNDMFLEKECPDPSYEVFDMVGGLKWPAQGVGSDLGENI